MIFDGISKFTNPLIQLPLDYLEESFFPYLDPLFDLFSPILSACLLALSIATQCSCLLSIQPSQILVGQRS